jgi:glucose-6-phosphate-specific signal transduction histidine kinase
VARDELDLEVEVRAVLKRFRPQARNRSVAITFAIQPGVTVTVNKMTLRRALARLVAMAIRRTPHGAILVSGRADLSAVRLTVLDDSSAINTPTPRLGLEATFQALALQGCTLTINGRAGQGVVATLVMPGSLLPPAGIGEPEDTW